MTSKFQVPHTTEGNTSLSISSIHKQMEKSGLCRTSN